MSQSGTTNSLPGVVQARLFTEGSDTIVATSTSVTAGTNDPTFYTIVFSGVPAGEYRLQLRDAAGNVVESGLEVLVGATSWTVKSCSTVTETTTPASTIDVETALANPKKAASDGVSVESHTLPELIEAEKHIARKAAASNPARGMRFSKFVPGGTVGQLTE